MQRKTKRKEKRCLLKADRMEKRETDEREPVPTSFSL
jgi:hypothetical protein